MISALKRFGRLAFLCLAAGSSLVVQARTNLVTQYITPVANFTGDADRGWAASASTGLRGEPYAGKGIDYTIRVPCDVEPGTIPNTWKACNYGVKIGDATFMSFSKWVHSFENNDYSAMPNTYTRTAASPRYLYRLRPNGKLVYVSPDFFSLPNGTQFKQITSEILANAANAFGYDTSPTYQVQVGSVRTTYDVEYIQAAHTDFVYTVTYQANNGTAVSASQSITNTASLLPYSSLQAKGFVRSGYVFSKWNTSADGTGTSYADNAEGIQQDLTLYAQWTAAGYTLTFDKAQGSGGTDNVTATYGAPLPNISVPSRAGYAFQGYFSAAEGQGRQYYNASGEGLGNWDQAGNATLHAFWKAATYTVSLSATFAENAYTESVTVEYQSPFPTGGLVLPIRTGYDFTGYWEKADGTGVRYLKGDGSADAAWMTAGSGTVYAGWTGKTLTVTFNPGEGASVVAAKASKEVVFGSTYGELPTKADVKKVGYTFAEWMNATGWNVTSATTVSDPTNHCLFARWTPNQYAVYLYQNADERDTTRGKQSFSYDQPQALTSHSVTRFKKDGCDFIGWSADRSAMKATYADGAVVSNLTTEAGGEVHLYAVWQPAPYYVRFDNGEAKGDPRSSGTMADVTFHRDAEETLPLNAYVYPGHAFEVWQVNESFDYKSDGETVTNLGEAHTTNTLTACWTNCQYLVAFDTAVDWTNETKCVVAEYSGEYAGLPDYGHVANRGLRHLGWRTADGVLVTNGDTVAILSNQVFAAVWTNAPFALTFDANGGTIGGVATTNVTDRYWSGETYGTCGGLPGSGDGALPTPERTGWTFAGWWTGTNASESVQHVNSTRASVSNAVLYARWQAIIARAMCTVTFRGSDKFGTAGLESVTNVLQGSEVDFHGGDEVARENERYVLAWWQDGLGTPKIEGAVVESDLALTPVPTHKAWTNLFPRTQVAIDPDASADGVPWTIVDEDGAQVFVSGDMSDKTEMTDSALRLTFLHKATELRLSYKAVVGASMGGKGTTSFTCRYTNSSQEEEKESLQSESEWTAYVPSKTLESRDVGFSYLKDAGSTGNQRRASIRNLSWTNAFESPLAPWSEDLSRTNLTFTTGGTTGWANATDLVANDCLCVTNLPAARSAWVRAVTPRGSGVLTFSWKARTEKGYVVSNGTEYALWNYLGFNDNEGTSLCLEGTTNDWVTVVVTNTAREAHTYEWRLVNGSTSAIPDAGAWLKDVSWTMLEPTPWPSPGDMPGATETEKVQNALAASGFTGASAAYVTNTAMYGVVSGWSTETGVSPTEMSAARTPLLSSALDAPGLLDAQVSSNDVSVVALSIENGRASVCVQVKDLPSFQRLTSLPAAQQEVLKAAFGLAGSYGLSDAFSLDNLTLCGEAVEEDRIRFTVEPKKPDDRPPPLFFYRPLVR